MTVYLDTSALVGLHLDGAARPVSWRHWQNDRIAQQRLTLMEVAVRS